MEEKYVLLPANDAVQNWFEENIDKECSASSAVYKFRLWLESLQGMRQAGVVWVECWERKPDTYKVRFKDKHGNEFIGNYSKDTGQYWAYGSTQAINDVIYWRPQDESGSPAAREEDWISVEDRLPEIGEYIMIYNTERATLIGRLMSNGWVALFADGEQFMMELTATHWRPLPEPPKFKQKENP